MIEPQHLYVQEQIHVIPYRKMSEDKKPERKMVFTKHIKIKTAIKRQNRSLSAETNQVERVKYKCTNKYMYG